MDIRCSIISLSACCHVFLKYAKTGINKESYNIAFEAIIKIIKFLRCKKYEN